MFFFYAGQRQQIFVPFLFFSPSDTICRQPLQAANGCAGRAFRLLQRSVPVMMQREAATISVGLVTSSVCASWLRGGRACRALRLADSAARCATARCRWLRSSLERALIHSRGVIASLSHRRVSGLSFQNLHPGNLNRIFFQNVRGICHNIICADQRCSYVFSAASKLVLRR